MLGVLGGLVLLAMAATLVVRGGERSDGGTAAADPPSTVPADEETVPLGVELLPDGGVRFHIPSCATDGVTSLFWNVVLRDPDADLESWSVTSERPRRLRTVTAGVLPDGFQEVDRLEATASQMRGDTGSVVGVFRADPGPDAGLHFRLDDLREDRIAYRAAQAGPLLFASSPAALDAGVGCDP